MAAAASLRSALGSYSGTLLLLANVVLYVHLWCFSVGLLLWWQTTVMTDTKYTHSPYLVSVSSFAHGSLTSIHGCYQKLVQFSLVGKLEPQDINFEDPAALLHPLYHRFTSVQYPQFLISWSLKALTSPPGWIRLASDSDRNTYQRAASKARNADQVKRAWDKHGQWTVCIQEL